MNEELNKLLTQWGDETVKLLQARLELNDSVATGDLKNSIDYNIGEDFIQFNMKKYGVYVDAGSKPHWIPIAPLKIWAKAKGLPPKMAYAVRWNLHINPTKPHPFFSTVLEKRINELVKDDGILKEFFINMLNEKFSLLSSELK